jgi:hypothetical protein
MRWLLIAFLAFSLLGCGKDKKKRKRARSTESSAGTQASVDGEARKVSLAWDAQESPGKVDLSVVITDDNDKKTTVNVGSFKFNTAYTEGFIPEGCRKCVDRYSTCRKLKPNVLTMTDGDSKGRRVRLKGQLCARLGRECDHFCENDKILNVSFNDGVIVIHSYANCVGTRKITCSEEPKVLKAQRVAPQGSTLAKKRKKLSRDQAYHHCTRKYCDYGNCDNSGMRRCMRYYGHGSDWDCACG